MEKFSRSKRPKMNAKTKAQLISEYRWLMELQKIEDTGECVYDYAGADSCPVTQKKSRMRYLKERYKIPPEKRYAYPPTTNMVYGWKLGERFSDAAEGHGRTMILKRTFYERKNGAVRYADHYKQPCQNFELKEAH